LPPDETGPVPISIMRTEPHWFGVAPPLFLLAVALGVILVAIALLVTGSWPFGLTLLGLGALLVAVYLEIARRRRHSFVARFYVDARQRAGSTWQSLRARSAVAVETQRVHHELMLVSAQQRDAFLVLGEATYSGAEDAATAARERLTELEAREAALRSRLEAQLAEAGERIRRAKLSVEETMRVSPPTR
jgi:hypothetical protein